MQTPYWPLFGLRLFAPGLDLRYADDADLAALAEVAAGGIHDPSFMPFLNEWTEGGAEASARSVLQWGWRQRGGLRPDAWRLTFVTVVGGQVVGTQDIGAERFSTRREVTTGSWLGLPHQSQGIGSRMRAAVLHLAFAGLGAESATTSAFEDNGPSLAVTRKLGYVEDGVERVLRRGQVAVERRFRLDRAGWERHRSADVEIHGLTEEIKAMLGAA